MDITNTTRIDGCVRIAAVELFFGSTDAGIVGKKISLSFSYCVLGGSSHNDHLQSMRPSRYNPTGSTTPPWAGGKDDTGV